MQKQRLFFKFLREPLFHFLLIGLGFFFLFFKLNPSDEISDTKNIIITQSKIDAMSASFLRERGRAPMSYEIQNLIKSEIREELLYREALALGLDKNDGLIRRRLAQKMKYLFDDLSVVLKPSDEELKKFLSTHPEKFMKPATISFAQIYFDPNAHETTLVEDANKLLKKLRITTIKKSIGLGDRSLLPYDFRNKRKTDIDSMFGKEFTKQAFSSATNNWVGPFTSAYGVHLIYIHEHTEDHVPPLADIRDHVEREWMSMKEDEANEIFYKSLYQSYKIIVNDEVLSDANVSVK